MTSFQDFLDGDSTEYIDIDVEMDSNESHLTTSAAGICGRGSSSASQDSDSDFSEWEGLGVDSTICLETITCGDSVSILDTCLISVKPVK